MPEKIDGKENRLKALLHEWDKTSISGEYPGELVHAILNEMENQARSSRRNNGDKNLWYECLRLTARNNFIRSLRDPESQSSWADVCFRIIRLSEYSPLQMFEQRARDFPGHDLFEDLTPGAHGKWSYRIVGQLVRETAAAFFSIALPEEPRVAILSENSVAGACCDLACLFYDILDSPLDPHFSTDTLIEIFNRLQINIAAGGFINATGGAGFIVRFWT